MFGMFKSKSEMKRVSALEKAKESEKVKLSVVDGGQLPLDHVCSFLEAMTGHHPVHGAYSPRVFQHLLSVLGFGSVPVVQSLRNPADQRQIDVNLVLAAYFRSVAESIESHMATVRLPEPDGNQDNVK